MDWWHLLLQNLGADLTIIGIAAMTNVACALMGCFLVLRRMSLIGDALSHAILPGLVVAFLLSGSIAIVPMYLGAIGAGIVTTFLIETLHRQGNVPEDSSIGVVFTGLFALGIVLVKRYGSNVDLDVDCVLSGVLEMADMNTVQVVGVAVPRALVTVLPVLLLNTVFIVAFWKELKIGSFDSQLATTMGINATWMRYALLLLVTLTAVASFEQVGSILVVAMLIAPGATAHLVTDRLDRMMWIAAGIGVVTAVLGYWFALLLDANAAGAMATVVGIIYLVAACFSPRYGLLTRAIGVYQFALRTAGEDILGLLYRMEEHNREVTEIDLRRLMHDVMREVRPGSAMARWSRYDQLIVYRALVGLLRAEKVAKSSDQRVHLTEQGRAEAIRLVRSHRLWETFLAERLGYAEDHVHDPAMRMEHFVDDELEAKLEQELTQQEMEEDPHGREIP